MTGGDAKGVEIVYDGQCPVCVQMVRRLKLRDDVGPVRLVDARSEDPLARSLRDGEIDLDRGMVVRRNGRIHHGDEAMRELGRLSMRRGWLGRLIRRLFATERRGRVVYPMLVAGRRAVLALLGRGPIG